MYLTASSKGHQQNSKGICILSNESYIKLATIEKQFCDGLGEARTSRLPVLSCAVFIGVVSVTALDSVVVGRVKRGVNVVANSATR